MKVTKRFKEQLKKAKELGYKRVYRTLGGYRFTTYIEFYDIDTLLNLPEGTEISERHHGRWRGTPNLRHAKPEDISYLQIFRI